MSEREKELEERAARRSRSAAPTVLAALPNLPDPTAPDEDEVLREVGEAGATGRDHVELLGDAPRPRGGRAGGRARASCT